MLKKKIAKLEDVAEPLRSLYEKAEDGSFVLKLEEEGGDKLAEFRRNNIELRKQLEAQAEKLKAFEGIDPAQVKRAMAAMEKMQDEEDRRLLKEGSVDELVARKTARLKEGYEQQLQAARAEAEKFKTDANKVTGRLGSLRMGDELRRTLGVKKLKLIQGADDDVLARTSPNFAYDASTDTFKPRDGLFNKNGEPAKMEDWIEQLFEKAPHLFEQPQSNGDGSDRRTPTSAGGKKVIDVSELKNHLEDVANGKVVVRGMQ